MPRGQVSTAETVWRRQQAGNSELLLGKNPHSLLTEPVDNCHIFHLQTLSVNTVYWMLLKLCISYTHIWQLLLYLKWTGDRITVLLSISVNLKMSVTQILYNI
jgi:hypothetical protein